MAARWPVRRVKEAVQPDEILLVADGTADKWLVDPPREGAFALAKALADIEQSRIGAEGAGPLPAGAEGWTPPKRIVYVSCNPATLARDAGLLVHAQLLIGVLDDRIPGVPRYQWLFSFGVILLGAGVLAA